MITANFILENKELFEKNMKDRHDGKNPFPTDFIIKLNSEIKESKITIQELQSIRNTLSKEMSLVKNKISNQYTEEEIILKVNKINQDLKQLEESSNKKEEELNNILINIPNILDSRVPLGLNEDFNKIINIHGKKPSFNFKPKQHHELGESLNTMDFKTATKIAGSRFLITSGQIAQLQRALIQYMLDKHIKNGFTECTVPYLVNNKAMFGTGQLPKFDDNFKTTDGFYLIPTGEVPLISMLMQSTISKDKLPIRLTCYSECFRSEAGAAGKDTKGMFRQHQFGKIEMVSVCAPEDSEQEHQLLVKQAESILQDLELHYRVCNLCSGDIGFSSKLTYDLEVWLPGQNKFREISSCSNTGDFQSNRMKAKYKDGKGKSKFLHTLNGSGLAIGRTVVAILENYQTESGDIIIPKVLRKYMNEQEVIRQQTSLF